MPNLLNPFKGSSEIYSQAVLSEASLLAYYRQGEAVGAGTMVDSSGNSRNGVYTTHSPTLGQAGALFSDSDPAALYGSGTGTYGNVAAAAWMNSLSGLSLEFWFKTTASGGTIVGRAESNGMYRAGVTGGKLFVETRNVTTGTHLLIGSTTCNDGNWHHGVGAWNGSQQLLYLDGVSDATPFSTSGALTGTSSVNLKVGQRNLDSPFAGTIDEVAIYNAHIGPTRVAAHYVAR